MSITENKISEIKKTIQNIFPDSEWGNNGSVKIYSSVQDEYNSLKKGVGVRNISHNTQLKITGEETLDFLHRISTNNLKKLDLYTHRNTLFITAKGRMIDRATLFRFGEFYFLLGNPDSDEKLKSWIEKYIIMEDIHVDNISGYYTIFELLGPQTKSFMTMLCGEKVEQLDGSRVMMGDTEKIKTYVTKTKDIKGIEKYWVITESENTAELIRYINNNKSVFNLNFVGDNAYELFRIEKKLPDFPDEINDNYNPLELGLKSEIDFTKGCYIGQEVIARLDTYEKVQREIVIITLQTDKKIETPAAIASDNEPEVGQITTLTDSLEPGIKLGLALVKKKFMETKDDFFVLAEDSDKIKITFTE